MYVRVWVVEFLLWATVSSLSLNLDVQTIRTLFLNAFRNTKMAENFEASQVLQAVRADELRRDGVADRD
jgi:hypothetical protein